MASPTQWIWDWVSSRSWWWTEKPGVLQSIGSQKVRQDWATELNWTIMVIAGSLRPFLYSSSVYSCHLLISSFYFPLLFPLPMGRVMGPDAMILVFWMLCLRPTFTPSSFTCTKRLFSSSSFPAIRHLHVWSWWSLSQQSWFQLVIHPAQHFAWCTLHIS